MEEYRYTTSIDRLDKLKLNYIEIPYEALLHFKKPESKSVFSLRLMVSINNCKPWHGGVVSLGENRGYITVKTQLMKELGIQLDDQVAVVLEEDNSEYGMEFPEELEIILTQDELAAKRFLDLPLSKIRYIIYALLQVKNPHKIIDRTLKMMEILRHSSPGKEDMKAILTVK